ncbi:MAG: 2Fe-2S iron-sulfur cluster-binding protein, partial [Anaerolineae bacterium]|nr:2Fe-2S iron-sulfur cluster-binding protein [Anaerolineae bacterium]
MSKESFDPTRLHTVVFEPSGRRGQVAEGTTLLEAARQFGVAIESICGGRQTCAKCYVRIEEGEFPRLGVRSSADHVTPAEEREQRQQGQRGVPPAMRFSCTARVIGDVLVTVPEESQGQRQVVLKAARERTITVDPIVRLYYIELESPPMDAEGDRERVLAEMAARFDLRGLEFDLPALRDLAAALRTTTPSLAHQADGGREA